MGEILLNVMQDNLLIMIIIVFFFSIMLLFYSLLSSFGRKEKVIDKLDVYNEDHVAVIERRLNTAEKSGPIRKMARAMEGRSKKSGQRRKRSQTFKQADLPITFEELFIVKVMASSSLGLLTFAVSRNAFPTLLVVVFLWIMPDLWVNRQRKKRIQAFDDQLNEGLVMISNALKAGYSFLQALAVAADETQDPFSSEFKGLLKELSLGIPLEDGLSNIMDRMPSEDLKLIVNAIMIQKDVGGNLSEILENIAETIRERQKIKNEVRTLTAQGKMSGGIIMAMPFFLAMMIYLINPEYITALFETGLGRIFIGVGLFSQFLGFIFIRKIINIEF